MSDTFFTQNRCDRCFSELVGGRTCSWFTTETICMKCSDKENEIKNEMRKLGRNPTKYEGCGYIPVVKRRQNERDENTQPGGGEVQTN